MKTRAMLEARRSSLEEWMTKLFSDIELSRSMVVASFLELEAAARSSFHEEAHKNPESHISVTTTDPSAHIHPNASMLMATSCSSLALDYGSDTTYEVSDFGSPSLGRDNNSEVGTEDLSYYDDVTSSVDKFVKSGMPNSDEGLSMGHAVLEKLENLPKHKAHVRANHNSKLAHNSERHVRTNHNSEQNMSNGTSFGNSHYIEDALEHMAGRSTLVFRGLKQSNGSIGSDKSSLRGSESSSSASFSNSNRDLDFQFSDDKILLIPMDQHQKMNRVLMTMQRQLVTAKTDMEDLISRLNQEVAVKDYLLTKMKDLEVELETTKQKDKENLKQAILLERERVTKMQWDMEEYRRRSMELELMNSQQDQWSDVQPSTSRANEQTDNLCQELDSSKQQFEDLLKQHQELEIKSKADIRVLVKEVKSLRSSQAELTLQLKQSLREKSKMEEERENMSK